MMVRSILVSLVVVLLFGTSFCQDTNRTTTTTKTPTTTTPTPTTTKPTTTTTTTPTPTTTKPTSTTTTKAPTTTTTKTTTSTPTTTTVKTTTTPIPSKDTNWYVQNSNGTVCIAANLKADLKVTYIDKDNKSVVNNVSIPLNHELADSKPSTCNNHGLQVLALTINDKSIKSLSLTFNKTGNNVFVTCLEVDINVTEALFPNISKGALGKTVSLVSEGQHIFQVDNAHSYVCDDNKNYVLNVTQSGSLINKTEIVFENVKIQGFIDNKKREDKDLFSTESNCKGIQVSNLVPIVVGAALAGLVVIVLIAYFVGRRRSRRMAYQSV